jgi:CheY-like chemotaxis protein
MNASLRGVAVLVVDDDRDTLDLLELTLKDHEADVRTATRADDAVVMLEGWLPHVMIVDLGMPEVDGCSLLHQIRARPATREVPAIAFTAHAFERDRERTRQAGFERHIAKPLANIEDLVNAIAELAARSGAAPASRVRRSTPPVPTQGTG